MLYHGWAPPALLGPNCSSAGYSTQAPTPLGGSFGFNPGDSLACMAWKLAATLCQTAPTGPSYA